VSIKLFEPELPTGIGPVLGSRDTKLLEGEESLTQSTWLKYDPGPGKELGSTRLPDVFNSDFAKGAKLERFLLLLITS
jgi:hypothetical protein